MIIKKEIDKIEYFQGKCDNCKVIFRKYGDDLFFHEDVLYDHLGDSNWTNGSTEYDMGKDGEHYCDLCYSFDENDNFQLNIDRAKA